MWKRPALKAIYARLKGLVKEMSYSRDMLESMRRVEATRPSRLTEKHPRLTPEEKEDLLKKFHPDYRSDTMRPVKVGPNAGDRMPHEVADILEARSRIDPEASRWTGWITMWMSS